MIYNDLISVKPEVIDLNGITLEQSEDLIKYIDEAFITENKYDRGYKQIEQELKDLTKDIQDGKIEGDELKKRLESIKQSISILGELQNQSDNVKAQASVLPLSVGIIGLITAMMAVEGSDSLEIMAALSAGSLLGIFLGYIIHGASKANYDRVYTAFMNLESKCMIEKRKAIKENNKEKIKFCEKIISILEDFKKERREEISTYIKNANLESASVVNESEKGEIEINNFKQSIGEFSHYADLMFDDLKLICETTLFIIKKATTVNEKNFNKVYNDIVDKAEESNDKAKNAEYPNFDLMYKMLTKWGNTFKTKYSPYGMKVREKLEKTLADYSDKITDYLNEFYDQVSTLIMGKAGTQIAVTSKKLYTDMRHNAGVDAADKIDHVIASWYNGHLTVLKRVDAVLYLIRKNVKGTSIRTTLRYRILSKFVR